jgi:hypothetical protein
VGRRMRGVWFGVPQWAARKGEGPGATGRRAGSSLATALVAGARAGGAQSAPNVTERPQEGVRQPGLA